MILEIIRFGKSSGDLARLEAVVQILMELELNWEDLERVLELIAAHSEGLVQERKEFLATCCGSLAPEK